MTHFVPSGSRPNAPILPSVTQELAQSPTELIQGKALPPLSNYSIDVLHGMGFSRILLLRCVFAKGVVAAIALCKESALRVAQYFDNFSNIGWTWTSSPPRANANRSGVLSTQLSEASEDRRLRSAQAQVASFHALA